MNMEGKSPKFTYEGRKSILVSGKEQFPVIEEEGPSDGTSSRFGSRGVPHITVVQPSDSSYNLGSKRPSKQEPLGDDYLDVGNKNRKKSSSYKKQRDENSPRDPNVYQYPMQY